MAAEKMNVLNGMPSDRACLSLRTTSRHLPGDRILLKSLLSCTYFLKVAASGRRCIGEGLAKHVTMQCCRPLCALAAAAALCNLAATHVLLLKAFLRKATAAAACKLATRSTPHTCMLAAARAPKLVMHRETTVVQKVETHAAECCVASMTDSCEAAKAAGNAAWSVEKVEELCDFTRAIDLVQSRSSSAADKANLHLYYR
jgi:hypothetical protein